MVSIYKGVRAFAELAQIRRRLAAAPALNRDPERILLFGYMGIGDLLMMTPALTALKHRFPASRITLLTGPYSGAADLARALPEIDHIAVVDWRNENAPETRRMKERLLQEKFDVLLATYTAPIRFFMTWFADVPRRIGMCRRISFPNPGSQPVRYLQWRVRFHFLEEEYFKRRFFNDIVEVDQSAEHEIAKDHRLIARLTGKPAPANHPPVLHVPESIAAKAADRLSAIKPDQPLVGLHVVASPGQRWKAWPLDRYQTLLKRILDHTNATLLLFGTAEEGENLRDFLKDLDPTRVISMMGQLDVLETAAALQRCRLFIGGDSGPGHMAMAVGTPAIRLFGPSDQPGYAALDPTHRDVFVDLSCRPCLVTGVFRPGVLNFPTCPHKNCLNQMTVDGVYDIVAAKMKTLGMA